MLRLIELLQEAKQVGTLYHHTRYYNAANILKTSELCSSREAYDDGMYAVSFTRDADFHGNFLSNKGGDQCRFVINGDKLSNNYKIRPYAESEWDPRAESEEQVRGHKWFCIPILKYVERIDFLSEPTGDFDVKHYKNIIELCREKDIKIDFLF